MHTQVTAQHRAQASHTDTAMVDNASDTVPTESAVRGYVNRRLGYDVTGAPVANKLGPGVLAPNGAVPMTDDLNAASNTITNLALPVNLADAATKAYVDSGRGDMDEIKDLRSVEYNGVVAAFKLSLLCAICAVPLISLLVIEN